MSGGNGWNGVMSGFAFGAVGGAVGGYAKAKAAGGNIWTGKANKPPSGNGYRYVTKGEIEPTRSTGSLRVGREGETFFTKDLYNSGIKAQQRLSLDVKPTHRLEFEILSNPDLLRNGTKVGPLYGQPGLGSEFMTIDPVKIRIINVQPLR
jgi:hypothetical protein